MSLRISSIGEKPFVTVCLSLLVVGYLSQIVSPLRLTGDVCSLLSMAVSAYQGNGFLVDGHSDPHPLGYPFMVKTLLQMGLASSMVLVLLNLVFLFVGLLVWRECFRDYNGSALSPQIVVFILSSWVMIKHVTLPLTELLYFVVSSFSLFFAVLFQRETGRKMWLWFAASAAFAVIALLCRSIGVVLFPVLLIALFCRQTIAPIFVEHILKWKRLYLVGGASTALFLIAVLFLSSERFLNPSRKNYLYFLLQSYRENGGYRVVFRALLYRVQELGELFINVPSLRMPQFRLVFYFAGLAAWGVVLFGAYLMFRRKSFFPLSLYFVFYAMVMIVWPYYDARFWLPILPVLIFLFHIAAKDLAGRWSVIRHALVAHNAWFVIIGFAALLISTRTSFAGKEFSEFYGRRDDRMTYRYAFDNGKPVDMSKVNWGMVKVLRVFEPLAASNPKPEMTQPDESSSSVESGKQ